jgi:putative peptidoglycan lipid II flippase
MGKVAIIGLMAQVNTLALRYLASQLVEGSVTWYWNATRLVDFAQGIIAVGVGSALLPAISDAVARNDGDGFRSAFSGASRLAGSLLIPAAAFILFFPVPCVAVLYRHGEYSWADVEQTASALRMLVPFMLALAGIQIVKKPFFALDRRDALIGVGVFGVGLTVGLGMWLAPMMGVEGLALALSVSTCCQLLAYIALLARIVPGGLGLGHLMKDSVSMGISTLPAVAIAWFIIGQGSWVQGPTVTNFGVLAGAAVTGGLIYIGMAGILGIREVRELTQRIRRRLG